MVPDPSNPTGPMLPLTPTDPVPSGVTPPVFDDDRALSVDNITVNEGSPYGVFTVTGASGQKITLELQTTGTGDGHATSGTDYTPSLEYFNETTNQWTSYAAGDLIDVPTDGTLQVRVPIKQDDRLIVCYRPTPDDPHEIERIITVRHFQHASRIGESESTNRR